MPMKEYTDTVVHVVELVESPQKPLVAHTRFRNCTLVGPALVYFQNCSLGFTLTVPKGDTEAALYELSDERDQAIGVIVLDHCELQNCTLEGIGVIGRPEFLQDLRSRLPTS